MAAYVYEAADEAGTQTLGHVLAELLPDGVVVALCGTLGAGKTRLVQAICEVCGVDRREVLSPTFVLIHEYHGRRLVYHLDAYRLRSEDEFRDLGVEEYFEGPGLVLVEWADRVLRCLPAARLEIQIDVTGVESRRFTVAALGDRLQGVVKGLRTRLG